jgi:eukaryotic-like serine/threonine-protein kinase
VQTPEQWKHVKELFGAALELSAAERERFLARECAGNDALREEVQSLLDAHKEYSGLSEHPSIEPVLEALDRIDSIGPYQLIRKLGQGGMGQVWLAEQKSPVRRQVAIKLLSPGTYNAASMQRFERERQSLAMMDHPSIAKIFDAGSAPDGRPFFAMEYVAGVPITDYCDSKKLTVRKRLDLFMRVCEGVQHAHQKSIVHRDLKPSNILVAEIDGKPMPRMIDFGIAKPITIGSGDHTVFTQVGALIGTPGFMSPEQLNPRTSDIDTRTDVYSLGVLLYLLLTGSMPFKGRDWARKPIDEILREIREEEPPSPSARIASSHELTVETAEARGTDPQQLVSDLRGDLDWITMKAMEKDRERRYGTPSEFSADIERYLESRPVNARPASTGYRLQKYLRRNRAGVLVASGAMVLLLTFTVVQAIQLRRITRERDRANRVTDFMASMFKVSDPSEARGTSVTAREILDKSSKEIETGLAKDPALQATMMNVMGEVYLNLGLHDEAKILLEKAIAIRRQLFGLRNRETLDSMDKLAWLLQEKGKPEEAEKIEREILPIRAEILGPEDRDTLSSQMNLANDLCDEGKYSESEAIDRQALTVRRRVMPEDPITLMEMSNLAVTISLMGRYRESEAVNLEALSILNKTIGPEHPFTIKVRSNLADDYDREGRYGEAEQITRETLEVRRRILGPEHPDTLQNSGDVGTLLYEQGRYAEAEAIHRDTLAKQKHISGSDRPQTLLTMDNLANDLAALHRYPEAEQLSRDGLEIRQRVLGPAHPDTLLSTVQLAVIYRLEEKYPEAERLTRAALASQRKVLGEAHTNCASSEYNLALIAAAQGRREDALTQLQTTLSHQFGPDVSRDLASNPLWKPFQSDPRFVAIVAPAMQMQTTSSLPRN